MLRGLQNLQVVCHQKGACKHGISVSLVPNRAVLLLWWLDGLYRLPAVDVGGKIRGLSMYDVNEGKYLVWFLVCAGLLNYFVNTEAALIFMAVCILFSKG
jgi:hypothetical protein